MLAVSRRALLATIAIASLAACDVQGRMERLTPPAHDRFARAHLEALRSGDDARLIGALAPEAARLPDVRDGLVTARRFLPEGEVDTLRLVGVNRVLGRGMERSELTYELHTPAGWGLALITVVQSPGGLALAGLRTERTRAPLAQMNAFTFRGKGAMHLLALVLAIVGFGVSLAGFVTALRTPMPRRWLWAIVALFGVTRLTLVWTTGAWSWSPLQVLLLSAGFFRPGVVGPWIVHAGLPLGALAALHRVRRFRRGAAAPTVAPEESTAPVAAPTEPA